MNRFRFIRILLVSINRTRRTIFDWAVKRLIDPVLPPNPAEATNLKTLKTRLVPGDVVLICGNARISNVVKLLTFSQWSHVALYVGDRRDLLTKSERKEYDKVFGKKSMRHLIIDADPVRGVHLRPLDEYLGLMMRHCRPEAISEDDRANVIELSLAQLGRRYDIRHILRLMLFFAFPWKLLPENMRRFVTDFTVSEGDTICSRAISEAFHSVGYPIRPVGLIEHRGAIHEAAMGVLTSVKHRGKSAAKLIAGGRFKAAVTRLTDKRYIEIRQKETRHITPADYDLSRFFSVIKDSEDFNIRYKQ